MSTFEPTAKPLPLEGVCVVEIGHSLAAPYAGMILGSLGATVIKIESADGGDYARDWGPPLGNHCRISPRRTRTATSAR